MRNINAVFANDDWNMGSRLEDLDWNMGSGLEDLKMDGML